LRPKMSLRRDVTIWNDVLARRKDEPTQLMLDEAPRSRPMAGAAVETDVESRKDRKRATCRPKNCRTSCRQPGSRKEEERREGGEDARR